MIDSVAPMLDMAIFVAVSLALLIDLGTLYFIKRGAVRSPTRTFSIVSLVSVFALLLLLIFYSAHASPGVLVAAQLVLAADVVVEVFLLRLSRSRAVGSVRG